MKKKMKIHLLIYFLLILNSAFLTGQKIDSVMSISPMNGDTSYLIIENKVKNTFIGNSWYISSAYTFSKSHQFDFNFGRTLGSEFCGGAGCSYFIRTWGMGVSTTKNKKNRSNYLGNVFTEFSINYYFPFTLGTRLEYLYNFSDEGQFLKPSIGFSFLRFDIFYGYAIKIEGDNFLKHGITIRIKNYHKRKNWEHRYYSDEY